MIYSFISFFSFDRQNQFRIRVFGYFSSVQLIDDKTKRRKKYDEKSKKAKINDNCVELKKPADIIETKDKKKK